MPRTLHAYLEPARVPARADLQASIQRLGFKLSLDEAYVPHASSGYLPCTLEGEDAGVDLRFELAPNSVPEQGPRSTQLRLRWGGDAREQLSALIIATALAQDHGAWVVDPDSGSAIEAAALLKQARRLQADSF